MSGKLLEINAGGVSAKFNATAEESVFSKDEFNARPLEVKKIEVTRKGGFDELTEAIQSNSTSTFIVLTVMLRKERYYYANILLEYLKRLSKFQDYLFFVILDQDNKVFAYLTSRKAILILEREMQLNEALPQDRDRFVTALNKGLKDVLRGYELVTTTVKASDTNIFALEKMTELNIDALIVTDENDKLKGVVERVQLLSKLLLAIAK